MNFLLADGQLPTMGMPALTDFWLSVVLALGTAFICTLMSTQLLHILQISGYKLKGMTDWQLQSKFSYERKLLIVTFLSASAIFVTNILLADLLVGRALKYVGIIFFLIFSIIYISNFFTIPQKTPIKYTKRMSRLVGVVAVLFFCLALGFQYLSVKCIPYFEPGGVTLVPLFIPIVVMVAHFITKPVEKMIANSYIKKAKVKMQLAKKLKVVGVTGSYGKTTVKSIIANILAEKYKVCVTPFSYNTPLGLSKTILENLEDNDQVLVAEMGARNVGDIAELCKLVEPDIGVITGIGNQHLATFGSVENLMATKNELVEFVTSKKGTCIFNTDSSGATELYEKANCKKYQVNIAGKGNVYAKDITCSEDGSVFTLVIDGEEVFDVKTMLLGEHNISNILVAVEVAKVMGLSNEEIVRGINKLLPIAHRLAIVPSTNALVVIDDAYNGSREGAAAAFNVLSKFKGKKVVITPGLVELGNDQFNNNFELGREMSKACDYVIITGVVNYEAISSGLEFAGFDKTKIIRAGTLSQAVSMLPSITSAGDVVLFENDLPDNYV